MKYQSLRQIFKITEWKGGCVYKTVRVGYAWTDSDNYHDYIVDNITYRIASLSTKDKRFNGVDDMRLVTVETPSLVMENE